MKFLIDAHLPKRLATFLQQLGHDAVYTLELPDGNRTTDAQINALSIAQRRVVITKDADFIATLLLNKQPHKLLLVGTGNISNNELLLLFSKNIGGIATALDASDYVELTPSAIVQH